MGSAIWPDGTVAVAIPVVNSGSATASVVTVTSIVLGAGTIVKPAAFPVALGKIVPTERAVLQSRFASISVPGKYTLTVSGTYSDHGAAQPFTASAPLTVAKPSPTPVNLVKTTVTVHETTGTPTAPSPIPSDLSDVNPFGPPVPTGPQLHPFTVSPSHTGPKMASPGMSVTFIRNARGGQPTGSPPDPSTAVASGAGVVLYTANTYLMFSTDDGKTFPTQLNPTTIFPQSDGGLCCDQVILYNPQTDLFFWVLQYRAGASKTNRLRVAYAHPADLKTNLNKWKWFDLTQSGIGASGNLDYPDLAFTNNYLYVSVDDSGLGGVVVSRVKLSDITAGAPLMSLFYVGPNQLSDLTNADASRLTQDSPNGMYWGGHISTSQLEIYYLADSASSVVTNETAINTYCNSDFTTLAPDNQDWLSTKPAGTGAIIANTYKTAQQAGTPHGEVWLGFTAGRDDPGCTSGRPQPYVIIERIDDTTLNTVGEYDIWNTPYAFSYPSLATAPNGDIGVSVMYGGPSDYATSAVGYLGDYVVYYVEASDVTLTPAPPRDGDMFAVRNSGAGGKAMSSLGYDYKFVDKTKSTNCNTAPGCAYVMHYLQWEHVIK